MEPHRDVNDNDASRGVSEEEGRQKRMPEFAVEGTVAEALAVLVRELENFLDPDVIPDWLLTEQHTLGGRTPLEALRNGDLAEVLQAANATEHGAYT